MLDDGRQGAMYYDDDEEFDEEEWVDDDYEGGEEDLMHIFEYYASFGEDLPTADLHASKFYKLVRECRVLDNRITYPDIDLIFMRCTRSTKSSKSAPLTATMSYDQFVDALEVLALKKFPDVAKPPMALERLLNDHVLPLAERRPVDEGIDDLLVPELMDIFRRFKRPLQAIFMYYCARNKVASASWESIARSNVTMGIGKFLLFAREFDLLPHVVTKQALVAIYRAANLSPEHSDEGLNYSEFTESLGRIALQWYTKQKGGGDGSGDGLSEKVLTLLGVMDESEGMIMVLEEVGRTHSRAYSLQLADTSALVMNEDNWERGDETHRSQSSAPMSARVGDPSMSTSRWGDSVSTGRPLSSRSMASESRNTSGGYRFASGSQSARDSVDGSSVRFTSTMKPSMGAQQGSSMFKSQTKRGDAFRPKEVTPAPGLYEPFKSKWGKGVSGAVSTSARFPSRKVQNINSYVAGRLEPRRVGRR